MPDDETLYMGTVERALPPDEVVLNLIHCEDCCCRYVASPKDTTDVKLIDTRCIGQYLLLLSGNSEDPPSGSAPEAGGSAA